MDGEWGSGIDMNKRRIHLTSEERERYFDSKMVQTVLVIEPLSRIWRKQVLGMLIKEHGQNRVFIR